MLEAGYGSPAKVHPRDWQPKEPRGANLKKMELGSSHAAVEEMKAAGASVGARLRLMTYNVHSCVGTDRRLSHERIAEVIAHYDPDVVALQELDYKRLRSGGQDQARLIADDLGMMFHFHPALRIKEEMYGDAILSKRPLSLRKAGELPTVGARRPLEPRGALWVSVTVGNVQVQIINTHLGLNGRERMMQIADLLGTRWIGAEQAATPMILCGDFNSLPGSAVHRRATSVFRDAQRLHSRRTWQPTFPSYFPMVRLDYVFVSPDLRVERMTVPRTRLTQTASDHLPVVVDLRLVSA